MSVLSKLKKRISVAKTALKTKKAVTKMATKASPALVARNTYVAPARRTYAAPARSSGYSGGGGGGGGYNSAQSTYNKMLAEQRAAQKKAEQEKKEKEKKEAEATKKAVKSLQTQIAKLESSRKQALANILTRETEGRALIDGAFDKMAASLDRAYLDNVKSEHDASYVNKANRGRERGDALLEAASHGAGETDNLRTQAMAMRNWMANQTEVNRAFHDTQTSISGEATTLNETTRQNLHNLYGQGNIDRSKIWDDYYKSTADVWTQIFNAENAMAANEQYKVQYKDAGDKAADAVGGKWKDPGVPKEIQSWEGLGIQDQNLNSSLGLLQDYGSSFELKRPEGATLRKW